MKRLLVVAAFVAVLVLAVASGAFAGEVKGPPGTSSNGDPQYDTQGPAHAASACVYSGLNDYNQGQVETQTQNWGQDVRLGIAGQEGPIPGIGCNPTKAGD
jgi:hypothetical protein